MATYAAFQAGEVDVVASELTSSLYGDAIADPNVLLAPVADLGTYQFDINNNWTIATYPGTRSPTSYQSFRQAIALLVDKPYILSEICGGLAERIDQPLGSPQEGWMNSSYCDPNYPYEYDPVAAAALLDSAGFVEGSTPNPYYDAAFPGSTPNLRTYPPGHETAGADIQDVITYVRTDDARRFQAGRHLYGNMRKIGIPVDPREGPSSYTYDPVMGLMDYHIYTGGWSLGRFPTPLYELFHSSFWYSGSSNYVTGMNANNLPNYPSLDNLLYGFRHSETNEEAKSICKNALGYFTELCVNIPLWSSVSYWAYSSSVLGVVNMEGKGLENGYSFMNAYKSDGSPIRIGTVAPPNAMNILHSSYYSDYQNLNRMNLYGGLETAPHDLSVDQAGFVRDWETTTWFDTGDGESKTKLTVWFREDAYFAEPETGNQKAQVNANHFAFSAWYGHATVDSWHYPKWENVHHIDIVDLYTVNIYFDSLSFWNTYYANGPILPIDTWLQPPLAYEVTEIFTEGVDTTTPGVIGLSGVPVWINSVTADDAPLTMFTDYNIINGQLETLTALPPGSIIEVSYWYVGDSHGFTPGNLPWPIIFEGAGMYYCTSFNPGVGGWLTLKANPYYWQETPPLGEADWRWYWIDGDRPRNGYFQIDINDLVMLIESLGSSGTAIPTPAWNPTCDFVAPAGEIDVYEMSTAKDNCGTRHGGTQPNPPPKKTAENIETDLEWELGEEALLDLLEKNKDKDWYDEAKGLFDQLLEKAKEKAKGAAKEIANEVMTFLLEKLGLAGLAEFSNVIFFACALGWDIGGAIGKYFARGFDLIAVRIAIGLFSAGEKPKHAFPYIIDWQIKILERFLGEDDPLADAKYRIILSGPEGKGDVTIPKKGMEGLTNQRGFHQGSGKWRGSTWPKAVKEIQVEDKFGRKYRVLEVEPQVELIWTPIDSNPPLIIFRVLVKVTVEEVLDHLRSTEQSSALLPSLVKGYVVDRNSGNPIELVTVDIHSDFWGNLSYTNQDGYCEMPTTSGNLTLSAWTDGYYFEEIGFSIEEMETKWLNITLKPLPTPSSTVQGYVRDWLTDTALPLASVFVYGFDNEGYEWNNGTWTDINGHFALKTIPGNLSIVFSHQAFHDSEIDFEIKETEVKNIDHELQFIPDLSLTGIAVTPSIVGEGLGRIIEIKVEVKNGLGLWGTLSESCQVLVWLGNCILGIQDLNVTRGDPSVLSFFWNSTAYPKGNYTVEIFVSTILDDFMVLLDNSLSSEIVVTIPGDVNGDQNVDIFDIVRMATIYGVVEPDPAYDSNCDVDDDGDIDIFDIVAAASHYGESW